MVVGLNGQNLESAVSPVAVVYKADEEIALILHQLMVAGTVKVMEKNLGLVSEGTVQVSYTFRLIGSKVNILHCLQDTVFGWSGRHGATAQQNVVVESKFAVGHLSLQHLVVDPVLVHLHSKVNVILTIVQVR